jgi:epoxide hydrolase
VRGAAAEDVLGQFREDRDQAQVIATLPTGCSVFPKEIHRPSRRWADKRFTDIRYWNEPPRGGHFAAFEQPNLFVADVRAFFRTVRQPPH